MSSYYSLSTSHVSSTSAMSLSSTVHHSTPSTEPVPSNNAAIIAAIVAGSVAGVIVVILVILGLW